MLRLNDTSVSGDFLVLCLGFMIHITSLLIFMAWL